MFLTNFLITLNIFLSVLDLAPSPNPSDVQDPRASFATVRHATIVRKMIQVRDVMIGTIEMLGQMRKPENHR